jgi:hypothetical protein
MSISLEAISVKYLTAKKLSGGTRKEYKSTVTKWIAWGNGVDVDQIEKTHVREFLDWVHEKASEDGGSNPGRTANKARENLDFRWITNATNGASPKSIHLNGMNTENIATAPASLTRHVPHMKRTPHSARPACSARYNSCRRNRNSVA